MCMHTCNGPAAPREDFVEHVTASLVNVQLYSVLGGGSNNSTQLKRNDPNDDPGPSMDHRAPQSN